MLKKSLVILTLLSAFSPIAQAVGGVQLIDISGDEDRVVSKINFFQLIQVDENLKTVVEFIPLSGPRLNVRMYEGSRLVFHYAFFKLSDKAQVKIGYDPTKDVHQEEVSTQTLRQQLLEMPLRDLLHEDSLKEFYRVWHREVIRNEEYHGKKKTTMEQLLDRLPDHLPLQAFLVDPRVLFADKDPNLSIVPLFKGKTADIDAQFMKKPSGVCAFTLKVSTKTDVRSFIVDPGTLVQDEDVTRLLTSQNAEDFEKTLLPEKLGQLKMSDLLGPIGHKSLIAALSEKDFQEKENRGSTKLDYSNLTENLRLFHFCQILDAKLATAQLVTWKTK